MKSFEFGNYIASLRRNLGLSQKELASRLNVSNKAISKWENGSSNPTLERIQELAKIFKVPFEEFVNKGKKKKNKKIFKIVITGGPCSGKSTALSWIQANFTKKGYSVIVVAESATELILSGVAPWTCERSYDFQKTLMEMQLAKEEVYDRILEKIYGSEKILVVFDRGLLDCKIYLEDYEFDRLMEEMNLSEIKLRDNYDGVFHLVTAAKGAEEFYTLENNKARTETIEEAREKDDRGISVWAGHPHFRIVGNEGGFEDKMKKLMSEISALLGEPVPYEIERKFLIEMPNLEKMEKNQACKKVEIIQTYLKSENDDEIRVRQRGYNGSYIYTKTIKKYAGNGKRFEFEERISEQQYLSALMEADITKRQIRKTRYCLVYENQYFEIDIYPFWKDKAILEIEFSNENREIKFPKCMKIIKEVTDDEEYKNTTLASRK
ncbi:MAG: AAA family ATPase [Clostridia bacterium]|nr:AAA family ATPase [Clostridia bacterium]